MKRRKQRFPFLARSCFFFGEFNHRTNDCLHIFVGFFSTLSKSCIFLLVQASFFLIKIGLIRSCGMRPLILYNFFPSFFTFFLTKRFIRFEWFWLIFFMRKQLSCNWELELFPVHQFSYTFVRNCEIALLVNLSKFDTPTHLA